MISDKLIESEILELKREFPTTTKLAIEMIALANTKGGKIIIGYDEKKAKFVGCDISQKNEELIANIITDLITPKVNYEISYNTHKDVNYLTINIIQSASRPHYLKTQGLVQGAYIRVGSTSRIADNEDLSRLLREGKNIPFDSLLISKKINLDKKLLSDYFSVINTKFNLKFKADNLKHLEKLGLIDGEKATIAGAMLFSKDPQVIPELSNSYIKAGRFKGGTKGVFIDQRNIYGPIPQLIDEAIGFTLRHLNFSGNVKGMRREDLPSIPVEILREVVTNAVIHRDYSISGSCIQLLIYDDRIEVVSPGGLPSSVTVDNIIDKQYSRNPTIAKRMFEMGFFDSWGQGINKILEWAKAMHIKMPIMLDGNKQFSLIVFNSDQKDTSFQAGDIEIKSKVLKLLEEKNQITNKTMRESLGLSKTQAQQLIKKMLEDGSVRSFGKGRSVTYVNS